MRALERRAAEIDLQKQRLAFREALEGLPDAEKLRALALALYEYDRDPEWAMSSRLGMGTAGALAQDPELISDYSELKRMIGSQQDPRKFFLLMSLVPRNTRIDFLPEMAHMLLRDGRISKDEGEYTPSYSHDVSLYVYKSIVNDLGSSRFQPPEDIPHESKVVVLGKWLKANWPGCENLQLAGTPGKSSRLTRPSDRRTSTAGGSEEIVERKTSDQQSSSESSNLLLALVFLGSAIAVGAFLLKVIRRRASE